MNELNFISVNNHFKIHEMCNITVEEGPYNLGLVPDQYKTQDIFKKFFERMQFEN